MEPITEIRKPVFPPPADVAVHIVVRTFHDADGREWDRFVIAHPHGNVFHLIAWKKTIEQSFPYKPVYLVARDPRGIRGVLPLFLVANFAVGRALISTPFAVYGGILADSEAALRALYNRAKEIGNELNVDYIELRNAFPEQCAGESNVSRYVTFAREMNPSPSETLASLSRSTRKAVRQSQKSPFSIRYGIRNAAKFNEVFSRNMRRLGSPTFPRRYFERLLINFGEMVDIREVWLENRLMAASVNFFYRDQMHAFHSASDRRFGDLYANYFLYFDHLCWGGQNGYRIFDFGRSKKETNVADFKSKWNTSMRELPYEIVLVRRKQLPNFSPANPRFDLVIKIWKKLPLWVTRVLGPRLIKLFPG